MKSTKFNILKISKIITEDPDINYEKEYESSDTGSRNYQDDEVLLSENPYIIASVNYEYEVKSQGKYVPPTRIDPPEYPEHEFILINMDITPYDAEGNEYNATPEEMKRFKEVATSHFYKLEERLLELESDF